jgi:hypothetical protein
LRLSLRSGRQRRLPLGLNLRFLSIGSRKSFRLLAFLLFNCTRLLLALRLRLRLTLCSNLFLLLPLLFGQTLLLLALCLQLSLALRSQRLLLALLCFTLRFATGSFVSRLIGHLRAGHPLRSCSGRPP